MPIHILSDDLASKIAAGEVIERPASVVKELIENAIDAGARDLKIETRGGGQRLIRVIDDGEGIPANEIKTAFARHATSKISTVEDLFNIHTLGFRGEALPSIAAVARVALLSRARGLDLGAEIRLDGGKILAEHAQGAPFGTIVTVEDLFKHVPARLKFLKSAATEAAHIAELVIAYALAYPALRFSLVSDGRLVFQSAGTGELRDVMIKVFGLDVAREMIAIAGNAEETRVSGFVSPPSQNRSTRKYLYLFVNGRWIQDRALAHAVVEAYHTLLLVGRYPLAVVNLSIPPAEVDVNVHPTKGEVRFKDPHEIFSLVQRTVRAALVERAPVPQIHAPVFAPRADADRLTPAQLALEVQRTQTVSSAPLLPSPPASLPILRVLGQILSTYIIAEGPDGLYLIDQHAAHERVLYDQMIDTRASVPSQALLEPLTLNLTPAQLATLRAHLAELQSAGFGIEPFGSETYLLRAVPAILSKRDARSAFPEILDELEAGEAPVEKTAEARLVTAICKGAAVKGGQILSLEEMRDLVKRLEQTTAPRTCPHGRPTMIQLNAAMLEREFGRK
jgi:DNA mismatch repair protein MutL